jgi:hypothetical protein
MPPFFRAGFLGAVVRRRSLGAAGLGVKGSCEGLGLAVTTSRRAERDGLGLKLMGGLTALVCFFIDSINRI